MCGSPVAPELADPVGAVEVGEHEDVEQLSAGSRAESLQTLPQSTLKLVGSHGRRLRRCVSANEGEPPDPYGPTRRQPAGALGDAEALTDPLRVPSHLLPVESAHAGVPGGETSAGTNMSRNASTLPKRKGRTDRTRGGRPSSARSGDRRPHVPPGGNDRLPAGRRLRGAVRRDPPGQALEPSRSVSPRAQPVATAGAPTQLAAALRKLLDEGYSMTDLGWELGITRQAIHVLLRRAER
jgi:hypothetical protein